MDYIIPQKNLKTGKNFENKELPNILGNLAEQALLKELYLSPKPGLVDQINSGCHEDMNLEVMERSIYSIKDSFKDMIEISLEIDQIVELRQKLSEIGIRGERQMKEVTNGVNTHKGALWNIGLLISAVTLIIKRNLPLSVISICDTAGAIARIPLVNESELTHGRVVQSRYGYLGARGEAFGNFQSIKNIAYPYFKRQKARGISDDISWSNTLFRLMSHVDDTCILYRGNKEKLGQVKKLANRVIESGGINRKMGLMHFISLEKYITQNHLSPGGSADLLGATCFVDLVLDEFVL